ncbi:DNA-binding protein [Actinacidiphila acidipaludis]|uniref:DNA-binding protein n=1 Tax=Actinacidiphila acidipaludis TaxID=2873382 RepID=A0ABS7QBL3_9ACTN|nr:DNA-binding protein [Streptomyces acidipaludis]MBY8879179.1 DNA-binding protein [Streptomyces acidipaludis]
MSQHVESVVLGSEGLSAWVAQERKVLGLLKVFHEMGADLIISANTIVEVSHSRVNMPRLQWTVSRVKVEPVTEQTAKEAARLLKTAGLHGHKYAVDATVAEGALRQAGPVVLLTSDIDDMARLCGKRIGLIGL